MRHAVWAAAAAMLFLASNAFAQGEDEEGEGEGEEGGEKPSAGMMEDSGSDPADTETLEDGEFAPKGKTGKLKDEEEADEEADAAAAKRRLEGLTVFGQVVIGFADEPPIAAAGLGERDATSYTIMIGGEYFFSKTFGAGLRVPWTTASIGQPAYSPDPQSETLGTQAFGAPELSATYRVLMGRRTDLPLTFAVGVPIAQGEPDPSSGDTPKVEQARVNRVADGAHGWRDGELFTPAYLPITLAGAFRLHGTKLNAHAFLKLNIMPKLRGSIGSPDVLAGGTIEQKSLVFRTVLGGGADYAILPGTLKAGLDAWFVANLSRAVEFTSSGGGSDLSRFQLVFEPKVGLEFGIIKPYAGFLIPTGRDALPMNAFRVGATADIDL